MLQDQIVMAAVSKIVQRSERQEDAHKLIDTYVDVGLLPQIENANHQILYGRRGTGKTHVIKVLESRLTANADNAIVYIDCRMLGSTSQFSDTDDPLPRRGRPERSARPHPTRLRPDRHRLGRRPSDRRPRQGHQQHSAPPDDELA